MIKLLLATPLLEIRPHRLSRKNRIRPTHHLVLFFLNNQRGIIGRSLSAIPPQSRIAAFMGGQLVYMVAYEFENIEGAEERAILKVKDSTEATWFVQAHYRLQTTESHGMQIRLLDSNEFRNQMYTDDDNNWWSTDDPPVIFVFIYSPHTPSSSSKHPLHSQSMSTQSQATPERNRFSGPAPYTNKKPTRRGGKTQKILADIPGPFPIRDPCIRTLGPRKIGWLSVDKLQRSGKTYFVSSVLTCTVHERCTGRLHAQPW
ncbi:hypothetical protein D9758_007400 [Tetrapyrgos nigripes]|uniref:Uncharacterized protein n=1 Tax=Tetrapyrgos nigripes TaxID=182062 RepID=A0A8H5G3I5_9AGAR|nr:hypothetical protein D9758_007400 [Tetrapyrgos nigripes]